MKTFKRIIFIISAPLWAIIMGLIVLAILAWWVFNPDKAMKFAEWFEPQTDKITNWFIGHDS